MTLPKTELLSTVLQFHLLCLNWYWHSLMPVFAPSPMNCIWSWYNWQSFFCPWESPASWLHSGWAPIIYTSDIWTGFMGFMGFIPKDLHKERFALINRRLQNKIKQLKKKSRNPRQNCILYVSIQLLLLLTSEEKPQTPKYETFVWRTGQKLLVSTHVVITIH